MSKSDRFNLPPEFKAEQHKFYHMAFDDETVENESSSAIYDSLKSLKPHLTDKQIHSMGGMKVISKVNDLRTGRLIAMAELKKCGDCLQDEVDQFLREARITATLEHPNIVPIYDIGLNKYDKPFFTMKFMKDDSLKTIIRELLKANPLYIQKYKLNILLDIFIKICDAVSFAHSCGVIHLDIKPDNIMIGNHGEVYVCDWGIAKILSRSAGETSIGGMSLDADAINDITLSGVVKGTPGYMAPEQVDSKLAEKNETTDIYALGAILYTLLTLKKPYSGLDVNKVLTRTLTGKLPSPKELRPGDHISESLNAICVKAMSLEQKNRYSFVDDIISEVRAYQEGFATEAESKHFVKNLWMLLKRNSLLSLMTLLLLITAGGSFFMLVNILRNRDIDIDEALLMKQSELVRQQRTVAELQEKVHQLGKHLVGVNTDYKEAIVHSNIPFIANLDIDGTDIVISSRQQKSQLFSESPAGTGGSVLSLEPDTVLHTGLMLPDDFTIAFWVKTPSVLAGGSLNLKTDNGEDPKVQLWIDADGSISYFTYSNNYPTMNAIKSAEGVIKVDSWHHIALSHKGEVKEIKDKWMDLLVDGVSVAQSTKANFAHNYWGKLTLETSGYFVDELRVWKEFRDVTTINVDKDTLSADLHNMIGWFKFDDKSTKIRNCIVNQIDTMDSSFSSQRVLLVNNPSGTTGNGLNLSADDTFATGINLPSTFTISFWAKTAAVLKKHSLVLEAKGNEEGSVNFHVNSDGVVKFYTYSDANNSIETKAGAVKAGVWTHFSLVHKGANCGMNLYINGVLSGEAPSNFEQSSWGKLIFNNFGCVVDEIRIWKGPLDGLTILIDKDKLSPLKSGLIGWYKFDQKLGENFKDSSGNNKDVICPKNSFLK